MTAVSFAAAYLEPEVGLPIAVVVALGSVCYIAWDMLRDRRRSRGPSSRPPLTMDKFHLLQEQYRLGWPQDGWTVTCEPSDDGITARLTGPGDDGYVPGRCRVKGPKDGEWREYEYVGAGGDSLYVVRWPDEFSPTPTAPVPAGVYWIGWDAQGDGQFLEAGYFTVTPEGRYEC